MFKREIVDPFLRSVNYYGNNHAFCINNEFYSYNDFAWTISKIRNSIKQNKIINSRVGLIVNDDLDTYASIFAIWLEGYAFVPIHPLHPQERNLEIIKQADLDLIIDSKSVSCFLEKERACNHDYRFQSFNLKPRDVSDDSLAYILYTSGSTGNPKGVQITRRNLGAFMNAFWKTGISINELDRCLQCFDLTFDVSIQSFLVPLCRGACTYTVPHKEIKYNYVYGLLDEHHLTFGAMTPSMLRYLQPYFNEIRIPSMRYNIITAEASPTALIEGWSKCLPNAEIFNFYGPTETTIYCTFLRYAREKPNKNFNGILSIGKPMAGITAIIINEEGKILGNDKRGELCISGDQVTSGYWKNEDKNHSSFLFIDINKIKKRFYKTGDLCFIDDDGEIILVGRLDHQVKIQGYRIELGEIEFHARELLRGLNLVAIAYNSALTTTEIALCIEGQIDDSSSLLNALSRRLPYYMVPSRIMCFEKLPLNTNGKIDRLKIKDLISQKYNQGLY